MRRPNQTGNPRRKTNPVLRIEAVLRLATSGESISHIAAEINSPRREIRRWARLYASKGLDGLCAVNEGGRPRTTATKPVRPPAGKIKQPKQPKQPKTPDPEREAKEEFKATVIAQLEARQRALEEEARVRKAEREKQEALEDERWKSSRFYTP